MSFLSWPPDSSHVGGFHVAPSRPGSANINTLTVPKTKVYAFWSSPTLLAPMTQGWHVHAASVPGRGQQFDVRQGSVHWEQCQVGANGLTDLVFSEGRTYVFYLTADSVGICDLLASHLSWEAYIYRTDDVPPTDRILFPAQPLVTDDHGKEAAQDPCLCVTDTLFPAVVFNSDEHLELGQNVQHMVTLWALSGLVEGGAIIDAGSDQSPQEVDNWNILVPAGPDPTQPYGNIPDPMKPFFWRHILPDPNKDKNGKPWTPDSLKNAIISGDAAALSIGEIVMLGGDYFESFNEMKDPAPRGPVNMMKGFDGTSTLAYMLLDILNFPREGYGGLKWMERVSSDPKAAKKEINWKKVKKLVELMRSAQGSTKFSELHALSQMWRGRTAYGKANAKFSIRDLRLRLPWFRKDYFNPEDTSKFMPPLSAEEFDRFYDKGFDEMFFSTAITNGHYAELALKNDKHFNPLNWQEFEDYHSRALQLISQQVTNADRLRKVHPIPAEAIALTAYGCHFLTDAFSSGHMRVPRQALGLDGSLAAKVMHDTDGYYGLEVSDQFQATWRAFGDGYLDVGSSGNAPDAVQKGILDKIKAVPGGASVDPGTNRERAIAAAGSAFKQLHYEAQRHYHQQHKGPSAKSGKSASAVMMEILKENRQAKDELSWDDKAPGAASDESTFVGRLYQDIAAKIKFMKKYQPVPAAVAGDPLSNHPPLFDTSGALYSGKGVYDIDEGGYSNLHDLRILRLSWHGFAPMVMDDFGSLYWVAEFTKGAVSEGWVDKADTKILDVYNRLPKKP